jgi:AbrB family looped-hinge helix DNA binding protein
MLSPFSMVYGIVNGMEVRIDKSGRIVVPKPLRERLGFKPDTELEAVEQPDGVLLKRVEQRPSMFWLPPPSKAIHTTLGLGLRCGASPRDRIRVL